MSRRAAKLAPLALLLAACTGHLPWARVPETTPARAEVTLPQEFSVKTAAGASAEKWWTDFDDPGLDRLIAQGLSANPGLRQAWARLAQAHAVLARTAAGRWPEISAQGDLSRSRSVFFAGEELGERQFTSEQVLGVFAASWELDLWRRIGSLQDAARLDREVARDELETAALTLAGEIGETWFSLVEQNAQRTLLEAQIQASDQIRELVELRFGQGQATAPEVLQQRQQLASVEGQVPLVRSRIGVLEHRLSVLVGRPPKRGELDAPESLAEPPAAPASGVPGDLLRRRPDVRAAERRVASADYRLAAAIAERFPAIRLTGRTGYQGFEASTLPENWIWTIASNVITPLFDAGRRRAEVDRSRAVVEERLAVYGEVILRAIEEVENSLYQEARQREHVDSLTEEVDLARRTLREIRWRYANGLTEYLNVLTALQALQQAERALLSARKQVFSFRLQLYRSLGGSWAEDLRPELRKASIGGS